DPCPSPSPVNFCRSRFGGGSSRDLEQLHTPSFPNGFSYKIRVWRPPLGGRDGGKVPAAIRPAESGHHLLGLHQKHPYFGAVVGRVANRIAKGTFTLDGKEYKLAINNGPNSLHGGVRGFDKVLWTPRVLSNGIEFSRVSPDGEEGYPGELKVWVTYTLDGGELVVNYRAQASQTTPVNLTNHSYFNLAGQGSPNIYDHEVTIEADAFLPVDETLIPTGEIAPVQGTAFDLRKPVELGKHLQEFHINGFDHNFCLKRSKEKQFCARVHHAGSGRVLEVYTTQPGIQFYTGNFLDGTLKGKTGAVYPKHSGFCLETQNWPNAVNQPHFPPVLLKPGAGWEPLQEPVSCAEIR
uniref:Galactose mutarotase n=2 Tax=Sus scrofa TaxID=9823 RepID=A0A8D1AJ55_PIG